MRSRPLVMGRRIPSRRTIRWRDGGRIGAWKLLFRAKLLEHKSAAQRRIPARRIDAARSLFPSFKELRFQSSGKAILRGGLKNGSLATVARTRWRTASTVYSIRNFVPGSETLLSTLASATIFFNVGDQVVEVALPIWRATASFVS